MLWTGLPGPNLHLLVACAILDMERDTLMLSGFGSNEILKVRPTPAILTVHRGHSGWKGTLWYFAVVGTQTRKQVRSEQGSPEASSVLPPGPIPGSAVSAQPVACA